MAPTRYDFAIIGGGLTGLAAAMYAARLGLKTILFGSAGERSAALDIGGTITLTDVVENYPGFRRLTGIELAKELEDHTRSYDLVTIKDVWVQSVDKKGKNFYLHTNGDVVAATTLLIATGTKHRELKVPGHDEFMNKGVHYCALCDGPLYKGKTAAVVGGSDSAAKEALLLSKHASKVYLIARGKEIKPEPINKTRVEKNERITVVTETNVVGIEGEKKMTKVLLDQPFDGKKELATDALFVAIGVLPISELARRLGVKTNEKGEIPIDRDSRTNVPGVYAAGDVGDRRFKQAITGVAEGVVAAYSAYQDITEEVIMAADDTEDHPAEH